MFTVVDVKVRTGELIVRLADTKELGVSVEWAADNKALKKDGKIRRLKTKER